MYKWHSCLSFVDRGSFDLVNSRDQFRNMLESLCNSDFHVWGIEKCYLGSRHTQIDTAQIYIRGFRGFGKHGLAKVMVVNLKVFLWG